MSSLVFHIEADKVDTNLLESIKAFFGKQKIHISVDSETEHINNKEGFVAKIESAQSADHEYLLSSDELKNYIEDTISGTDVDDKKFRRSVRTKESA